MTPIQECRRAWPIRWRRLVDRWPGEGAFADLGPFRVFVEPGSVGKWRWQIMFVDDEDVPWEVGRYDLRCDSAEGAARKARAAARKLGRTLLAPHGRLR